MPWLGKITLSAGQFTNETTCKAQKNSIFMVIPKQAQQQECGDQEYEIPA
jgi:hypothetical protein